MKICRCLICLIFSVTFISSPLFSQEKLYDYLIKDALVFDGESRRPVRKDLAILGDQIVQVGTLPAEEAKEVVQAEGLIASPGFIDFHTHSDFNPFVYVDLGNKVLQGVTTEVVGNCGMSAAPVLGRHPSEIRNIWRREGVEIPKEIPWAPFKEYVEETEFRGLETNFVGLVGHGNLRSAVMGMDPRAASPEEIETMRKALGQALEEGAFGISFGLGYLPGTFASREELAALCREAGLKKGICAFHIRSESSGLVEALREAIEIGKAAQARIHISHLKASGEKNWPKIEEAFRILEEARASGIEVTADAYPYTAGFAELGVILPDRLYQASDRAARFREPKKRSRVLRGLKKYYELHPVSWEGIKVATVTEPKNFPFRGKSILEISKESGKSPEEVLVDLLGEEDFKVSAFYFSQNKGVVDQVLSRAYVTVGSDSIADGSANPHPRAYGTFPRRLAECLKEDFASRNLCWGNRIHQMTALPAEILGLRKRGRIGVGIYADLVLFDPASIRDQADYSNPKAPPRGIRWVFVNGKPVVREGKYHPAHSGLFLTPER